MGVGTFGFWERVTSIVEVTLSVNLMSCHYGALLATWLERGEG
jgi:hypothetical protein